MTKVIARVHPVHLMNVDWAPGGRQPSDQASRLGLWVRRKLAAIIQVSVACRYSRQSDSPAPAKPHLRRTWHIAQVGRLLPRRTQSVRQSRWSCIVISQLPLRSPSRQPAWAPAVHYLHLAIIVSVIAPFRNVHHAQYADDTQLYIDLSTDKALSVINDFSGYWEKFPGCFRPKMILNTAEKKLSDN